MLVLAGLVLVQTGGAATGAPKYLPVALEFASLERGLIELAPGPAPRAARIISTTDGGKTWRPSSLRELPRATMTRRFRATWRHGTRRGLHLAAIVSSKIAWGTSRVSLDGPTRLFVTRDGGSNWRGVAQPCPGALEFKEPLLAALTERHAWLLCLGQPGAGHQVKALYETSNARSWTLRAATLLPRPAGRGLASAGYGFWLTFTERGFGVIAELRGSLLVTRDGGRSWRPARISSPGESEAANAALITPGVGFVLVRDTRIPTTVVSLYRTNNAGRSWRLVRAWR
jgi:hypothetical protein